MLVRLALTQPADPVVAGGSGAEPTDWTDAPAVEAEEAGAEDGAPVSCVPAGAELPAVAGAVGVAVTEAPGEPESAGEADPVGVAEAADEAESVGVAESAGAVVDAAPEGDVVGAACVAASVGVAVALVPDVRFWSAPASVSVSPL
jgi:hypothetical protein